MRYRPQKKSKIFENLFFEKHYLRVSIPFLSPQDYSKKYCNFFSIFSKIGQFSKWGNFQKGPETVSKKWLIHNGAFLQFFNHWHENFEKWSPKIYISKSQLTFIIIFSKYKHFWKTLIDRGIKNSGSVKWIFWI